MRNLIKIIPLFLLSFAFGQELKTILNKASVQIGEPFELVYSVNVTTLDDDSIHYEPQRDFFSARKVVENIDGKITEEYPLEIASVFKDTLVKKRDSLYWNGYYEFVAWDSVTLVLPPAPVRIGDSSFTFPPKVVQIRFPMKNPQVEMYDIIELFTDLPEPENSFFEEYFWFIIVVFVLLLGIIFYFLRKRKKLQLTVQLLPNERALNDVNTLFKSKLYEENLKEYYYELSLILRRFLAEVYHHRFAEKTTFEIDVMLKKQDLSPQMIDQIHQLLSQSDMVKFAQAKPPMDEVKNITEQTKKVIKKVYKDSQEPADE